MDLLLLRWLIKPLERVCMMHWFVGSLCIISLAGYMTFDRYLSWSKSPATDLSAIERRLNSLEAKQNLILKMLQLPQPPQISREQEAVFGEAHQLLATIFEVYRLDQKLQIPAF